MSKAPMLHFWCMTKPSHSWYKWLCKDKNKRHNKTKPNPGLTPWRVCGGADTVWMDKKVTIELNLCLGHASNSDNQHILTCSVFSLTLSQIVSITCFFPSLPLAFICDPTRKNDTNGSHIYWKNRSINKSKKKS